MNLVSTFKFAIISLIIIPLVGFEVTLEQKKRSAMPLAVVQIKPVSRDLKTIAHIVATDLQATGQFNAFVSSAKEPKNKKDVVRFAKQSIALAIYLSSPEKDVVEWRVYDTLSGNMVGGKLVHRNDRALTYWGHRVADQLWPLITSEKGFFSSVIVACKRGEHKKNKKNTHMYAFWPVETDGSAKKPVVLGDRINFAPRWHPNRAQIFYSQHSPFNVSLMTVLPGKRPRTIMGFDGQNMTPTVSKKGRVVISLSDNADAHLYEYQFDPLDRAGKFIQLTHGIGQYISPSFHGEDEIVFCYINKRGRPRIGMLNLKTKAKTWITPGHGVSPCVSPDGSKLSYSSLKDRLLQVHTYDFKTGKETQITTDRSHKDESSWSPCGNYLVFSVEQGTHSRIACLHIPTNLWRYLTPKGEYWSFPAWSPIFEEKIPFL